MKPENLQGPRRPGRGEPREGSEQWVYLIGSRPSGHPSSLPRFRGSLNLSSLPRHCEPAWSKDADFSLYLLKQLMKHLMQECYGREPPHQRDDGFSTMRV